MQPSAVERLDFVKHQTGASIGANATFCSGATGFCKASNWSVHWLYSLVQMQPSVVERLDFEKHQTGASIGS
ncbi:hypothetical protein [Flavobacterium sp. M31R6]|uniref:hypothetical protein n=1 Tax=Flavobacterium sp. M31R6 TaxID=2739062 RepID=UPI0015683549|nr:hypothetical protein [Flavobacterium sp. M31R6]QKJ62299.1 hypothetical protein HQN62_03825 [Flavobacterium sp. M31R6]QKJ62301.1 hypothetical protein HQN62_03835 [Flavobacterium sp. M31R6]